MQEQNLVITENLSVNLITFAGIDNIYFDSQQQQGACVFSSRIRNSFGTHHGVSRAPSPMCVCACVRAAVIRLLHHKIYFISVAQEPKSGLGPLIVEVTDRTICVVLVHFCCACYCAMLLSL